MIDLYEYETTIEESGGGFGEAEPAEPEPAPEPTPEPAPEPEAWAGVSQEDWQQTQAELAEMREMRDLVYQAQQPQYSEPPAEQQQMELPEYDPFDPQAAQAYFDAREQRQLSAIQQMLSPVTEQFQNQQAEQWVDQTLNQLGVPEEDYWRDGVLFASAGFQQFDAYGRPLVHPSQASKQAYEFLRNFSAKEREAERQKMIEEQAEQTTTLQNRANVPTPPPGPGGAEGPPAGMDEIQAARAWMEQESATAE